MIQRRLEFLPPVSALTTVRTLLLLVLLTATAMTATVTTATAYDCFPTTHDLHAAVDAVLWNRQRLKVSPDYTPLSAAKAVAAVYGPTMGAWCVSPAVTNLSHTFSAQRNPLVRQFFGTSSNSNNDDDNVGAWNVSHVTDFSYMFYGARRVVGSLDPWQTSRAVHMQGMFQDCCHGAWRGNLSAWNVSSVVHFRDMFRGSAAAAAAVANGVRLWNVSSAADAAHMFEGVSDFDADLCDWALPVDAVTTDMFRDTACPMPQTDLVVGVAACHDCSSSSSSSEGKSSSNGGEPLHDDGLVILSNTDDESGTTAPIYSRTTMGWRTTAAATLATLWVLLL